MRKYEVKEDAFTGLEAAIVLIAFVVVAAVFSYVVLGAGFFTTQKSQEVVHSGVTQAASNIVIKGEVYGIADSNETPSTVRYLQFDIGLAAGGLPVDMNRTTLTYSTVNVAPYVLEHDFANFNAEVDPDAGKWVIYKISAGSTNDMTLQTAETFTIRVRPAVDLVTREKFLIEVKPEIGAALGIDRTVPPAITYTTLLY
ncbi:MAG TPA: flagellin [Methanolinea sp.]|nr:flagellin [Methanolinea sp.]HQK55372.1 flagellin [Methanolinea sp.]